MDSFGKNRQVSIKSYRYRFYPTSEQEEILARTFGCVRYVYNHALDYRSTTYKETGKGATFAKTSLELTKWKREEETIWLKDVSCIPLQQSLRHLSTAFSNFFAKRTKYPRFKRRSSKQSAVYTRNAFKWDAKFRNLRIAKLGRLNIHWSRLFRADPSTVVIIKTTTGKYFVSICINEESRAAPETEKEVGVDLGITNLATLSDGSTIENPKFTKRYAPRLARAQRKFSRKQKGSNRRHRARIRVAKIHERIANSRLDWMHKATTKLINENQVITVEDLNVQGMVKNRKLSKAISDCSWSEFVRQLKYKADWYGRDFRKIGRFVPTSKTCSDCGHRMAEMPLKIRSWQCPECHAEHDRDVNAAINILASGRLERQNERGVAEDLLSVLPDRRRRRRSVKHLKPAIALA